MLISLKHTAGMLEKWRSVCSSLGLEGSRSEVNSAARCYIRLTENTLKVLKCTTKI